MTRLQAGLLLGVVWAVWHLPLFFIPGTVQAAFGLISWSGLLFTLSVIPMALLTGYAYERGGVPASVAVHFGVNTTIALVTIDSPVTQALVLAVQAVIGFGLLGRGSRVAAGSAAARDDQLHVHRVG
ncbi:type II CAAX prenyl endopeptidase Rce1 family protein [Amycolatopsis sp. lyj-109]|uniref:CPBP family glutamic-type intramembrane protease n=1 Tax=Amycolatopsis sp. lyj-109 TaxID=2789287 RepID=UPI00397B33F3